MLGSVIARYCRIAKRRRTRSRPPACGRWRLKRIEVGGGRAWRAHDRAHDTTPHRIIRSGRSPRDPAFAERGAVDVREPRASRRDNSWDDPLPPTPPGRRREAMHAGLPKAISGPSSTEPSGPPEPRPNPCAEPHEILPPTARGRRNAHVSRHMPKQVRVCRHIPWLRPRALS